MTEEKQTPMTLEAILESLPRFRDAAADMHEIFLANLVMIGETPAPTFGEEARVQLIQDRFSMCGLQNCSSDEKGNALGILPGAKGERTILVSAHADTVFPETVDHTISVEPELVRGAGVADNSLGLAMLASLPTLMEKLGIELDANLVLMGDARSLGRGDLEGMRFFLQNKELPVTSAICIEGVELGRLSYSSIGMLRGEIRCTVPEAYDWTRFGMVGAIHTLNEVINRITEIPLPRRPQCSIVLGSVRGGESFNIIATEAVLRFEVRSESGEIVAAIGEQIEDITAEVSAATNAEVTLNVVARREPGGLSFRHPLVNNARSIIKALDVEPRVSPSMSEVAALIDAGIPAVTIGMSHGVHMSKPDEAVQINPLFLGAAQLLGVLLAMDGGYCDEQ